tara:strand:- start:1227 stop:2111 length:885 start_codon:yes stop_codon:yes gene_type:complete
MLVVPQLSNAINLCHFNAVVQCLFAIPCFITELEKTKDNDILRLWKACKEHRNKNLNARNYSKDFFLGTDQEDSFETLERICSYLISINGTKRTLKLHKSLHNSKIHIESFKHWKQYIGDKYCNVVHGLFAKQCIIARTGQDSNVFDSILFLQLPIAKNRETLSDCLIDYFSKEMIEIDNKKCVRVQRLWTLSPILVIQLKRFRNNGTKINNRILYNEDLDVLPFVAPVKIASSKYKLAAILCHTNMIIGGHYYALIKDTTSDRWIKVDDEKKYDWGKKIDPNAYGFFYVLNIE